LYISGIFDDKSKSKFIPYAGTAPNIFKNNDVDDQTCQMKSKTKCKKKNRRSLDWISPGPLDVWADDGCFPKTLPGVSSLPHTRDDLGGFLDKYFTNKQYKKNTQFYKNTLPQQESSALVGVEIGVQAGIYSENILSQWPSCSKYILIDAWEHQEHYFDGANVPTDMHLEQLQATKFRLEKFSDFVELVYYRNFSSDAVQYIPDSSTDFIYIDARHDYCG
jgi:hypothetical protein